MPASATTVIAAINTVAGAATTVAAAGQTAATTIGAEGVLGKAVELGVNTAITEGTKAVVGDEAGAALSVGGGLLSASNLGDPGSFDFAEVGQAAAEAVSTTAQAVTASEQASAIAEAEGEAEDARLVSNKAQSAILALRRQKQKRQIIADTLRAQAEAEVRGQAQGGTGGSGVAGVTGSLGTQAGSAAKTAAVESGVQQTTQQLSNAASEAVVTGQRKAVDIEEAGAVLQGGINIFDAATGTPKDKANIFGKPKDTI